MKSAYKPQKTKELCTNVNNWVVMGNSLLKGKSSLTAIQAKIIRTVIMQTKIEDTNISPYSIKAKEMADLLNLKGNNQARDLKKACCDLVEKVVKIETNNPKKPWKVIPWFGYIEYTESADIVIQLNPWLSPYLIGLKKHYTQYILEFVLGMNSIYSIRVYELLKMKLPNDTLPPGGITVSLSNEEIRKATESEGKYEKNSDFKRKILDVATKEINEKADINVNYKQKKINGRAYDTVEFECKSRWDTGEDLALDVQCKAKLIKMNELRKKQGKKSLGMYDDIVQGQKFATIEEFELFLIDYISKNG